MVLRFLARFAPLAGLVTLAIIIGQVIQPQKLAFSCRSMWDCDVSGRGHQYEHWLPNEVNASISERELTDGTRRFERVVADATPDVLFLVLTRNENSWSRDLIGGGKRTSYDFLDVLVQTKLNLTEATLGLMTSSEEEYNNLKESTASLPFGRTMILYQADSGPKIPYLQRHKPALQFQRRSHIAKLRNYLMLRALDNEKHVVWVDADVVEFSPNIVQTMIHHSDTNSSAGIITARCQQILYHDYDKNAWLIDRENPTVMGAGDFDHQSEMVKQNLKTRKHIAKMTEGTTDDEIRPLDSVGGTILYIRANLVRQGANFPTMNVVGTTWAGQGWVGLETEGICYAAGMLEGGKCWTLGGSHHVRHSDVA